jgi:hypothetical protein
MSPAARTNVIERLLRIQLLAKDLTQELSRPVPETESTLAMVAAIEADIEAVERTLRSRRTDRAPSAVESTA